MTVAKEGLSNPPLYPHPLKLSLILYDSLRSLMELRILFSFVFLSFVFIAFHTFRSLVNFSSELEVLV